MPRSASVKPLRIGIDLGGTKIAGVVLTDDGEVRAQHRLATPQGDYAATCSAVLDMVEFLQGAVGATALPVGIGTPGTLDPQTHTLRGCNSTCLNGQPFQADLQRRLGRPVVLANDANCLVLSEAYDGAAQDAAVVFGVILGTGVGGALVWHRRIHAGRHGIGGEWGHTPMPGKCAEVRCWCGQMDCVEAHLCGPALARRAAVRSAEDLALAVNRQETAALVAYASWLQDLGRALAGVINIIDPDVVVFGGGVSLMPDMLQRVRPIVAEYLFAPELTTSFRLAHHGAASGVRGAARLTQS